MNIDKHNLKQRDSGEVHTPVIPAIERLRQKD
jgi:hypothetical protein